VISGQQPNQNSCKLPFKLVIQILLMWLGSSQLLEKINICVVPVIPARVTVSDTLRDLGVILDGRLNMADHVAVQSVAPVTISCGSCVQSLDRSHWRQSRQWSTRSFRHAWTTVIPYWLVWTKGSYGDYSPCRTPLHA